MCVLFMCVCVGGGGELSIVVNDCCVDLIYVLYVYSMTSFQIMIAWGRGGGDNYKEL